MSNVYATEPATSGRVIFETTRGPLEVQLWCKECPETTRIFLQLCLDGFYDNMIFHRIIPKTLIQVGALRYPAVAAAESSSSAAATAAAAAMDQYRSSIRADYALERRRYEMHSRLRFNHRGLVAMALAAVDDDDAEVELVQPQFFVTLEEASYLDGKHIIFGKVDAPTIFNAIKIGDTTDVDEATNQPTGELEHAPRIKSVKIVDNPIHTNIMPLLKVPWRVEKREDKTSRKKKRKGKRDLNVLSFGDELAEEDDAILAVTPGIKSSHDVLKSKTLSKMVDDQVMEAIQESAGDSVRKDRIESEHQVKQDNMKPAILPIAAIENISKTLHDFKDEPLAYEEEEPLNQQKPESLDGTKTQSNHEVSKVCENSPAPETKDKKQDSNAVSSTVEARRAKYLIGRKSKREREEETMEKLSAFQNKVRGSVAEKKAKRVKKDDKENSLASRMARRSEAATTTSREDSAIGNDAPTYHGQVLESDGEGEEKGSRWLQTQFKCRRHMDQHAKERGRELGGDGRDMDDYEVVDDRGKDSRRHRKSHSSHKTSKRQKEKRHERANH